MIANVGENCNKEYPVSARICKEVRPNAEKIHIILQWCAEGV
jgi:hypothetical protein